MLLIESGPAALPSFNVSRVDFTSNGVISMDRMVGFEGSMTISGRGLLSSLICVCDAKNVFRMFALSLFSDRFDHCEAMEE